MLLAGMVTIGTASSQPPFAATPTGAQNLFPVGMLGFSSFRGTVLVNTPTHLVAFATGRHSGGDVSARNVLVRTSTKGGLAGTWSTPKIIANVSSSSLKAGDGLYTGTSARLLRLAAVAPAHSLLTSAPPQVRACTILSLRKPSSSGANAWSGVIQARQEHTL